MKWVQRGHWIISAYYRLYSQTPHLMTWDFLMKLSKVRQLPTNANKTNFTVRFVNITESHQTGQVSTKQKRTLKK